MFNVYSLESRVHETERAGAQAGCQAFSAWKDFPGHPLHRSLYC